MYIHPKSKITTYALRLSVFCCQNRLITEPIQDKGGQFAADLCIVFIYFVFQHQLLKAAGETWQALVEFAFVYNNNNNNVHLSCAHQRPERSHDTY